MDIARPAASPAAPTAATGPAPAADAATGPVIALEKVSLSLGNPPTHILDGVDLVVQPGETVAVLGPSGSGKSSLMAVIAGLERPDGGTVRLAGDDVAAADEDRLAALRGSSVGIVLQAFHLLPTMTALDNVAVPLELAGVPLAEARARAAAELDAVGLGHRLTHFPAQLSGGEQQRVAIARATVTRPRLLLADEPTGNLDSTTGAAIIDLLFDRVGAASSALLVITHDPAVAARASRVVRMADGRLADGHADGGRIDGGRSAGERAGA